MSHLSINQKHHVHRSQPPLHYHAHPPPPIHQHHRKHTPSGEVAVQLLHLFAEVTTAAVAQNSGTTVPPGAALSPVLRSNSAASVARATQVASARALGRAVAASASCRSAVIRVARDPLLLVRLLPALRCHLTVEEVEVRGGG